MNSPGGSLPAEYFRQLYAASEDPWRISDGWFEQRKRALVLACLPRARFGTIFEPGCSNGALTVHLAARCDRLVAWDLAEDAVRRARDQVAGLPGVEIRQGSLPHDWPDEPAELIVLSEVGYYLSADDLGLAIGSALDRLRPGGTLLAVHWRHEAADYPLTGDEVHELIDAHEALDRLGGYRDDDVQIDVWTVGPATSVARQTGVL